MISNLSFITRVDPETGHMVLPEGKRKIFISYKHSDNENLNLCERLAEYILEELDVAIWYDHKLTAGKGYDDEIQSAIMQSDVLILLLTPNILSSKYILEQEIPFAIKQQVAIIPLIAGMSDKDIPEIEELVGRVHMPIWFSEEQTQVPEFLADSKEQFINGVKLSIANKDLLSQAKLFYEKGLDCLSLRNLTPDQMFLKAYGNLFGVNSASDKNIGIKLMESILSIYGEDKEFNELQEEVANELLNHLYRTNQPDLFFDYLKFSIAKDYKKAYQFLFKVYSYQWHPEILCHMSELSVKLFENLYQNNFGRKWDADEIICLSNKCEVNILPASASDLPHIGELVFDGHRAYFQKATDEWGTVYLFIDDRCIAVYPLYRLYFLYMAYDPQKRILITLHSDFDHYGPETITAGMAYRIDGDEIQAYSFCSEWLKGLRKLPYDASVFGIK